MLIIIPLRVITNSRQSISKAEVLNQHFKSVFTIEETIQANNFPDKGSSPYLIISDIEITEHIQSAFKLQSS